MKSKELQIGQVFKVERYGWTRQITGISDSSVYFLDIIEDVPNMAVLSPECTSKGSSNISSFISYVNTKCEGKPLSNLSVSFINANKIKEMYETNERERVKEMVEILRNSFPNISLF